MVKSGSKSGPQNPKVLALLPRAYENAVDYYRIVSAFDVLRDKGYPVWYVPYEVSIALARQGRLHPNQYDVFVLCRAAVDEQDRRLILFIETLRAAGKKLIYETDDDYTNAYRKTTEGDAITVAQMCDAITTTTPHLAKVLSQHNENVHILPNALNPGIWDKVEREPQNGQVTIALAGTGTHFEDWKLVQEALYRLAERDDVRFLLMGYKPHYLEDLPNMDFNKPAPYPTYAKSLGQVDIGLCPLVPGDKFNLAKSGVKALEFMAAGVAVVAQDMPVYRRVVANKSNGLLASDDWYEKIHLLVDDAQYRRRLARSGWRWVRKHRNIRKLARKWWRVYEEVYYL
jgi:glycosyltransferase involved in cell wall biosynthesis